MNYSVLYIRLDSYAKQRAIKGEEITEDDLNKASKREVVVTTLFTIWILTYPTLICSFLIAHMHDYAGDVIGSWERYELFYMFNFVIIAILLGVSTMLTLSHMRRIFGSANLHEEKPIKNMLMVFSGTYLLRVVFSVMLHFY